MKRDLTAIMIAATLLFSYNLKTMDYKLVSVVSEIRNDRYIVKEEVMVGIETYEVKAETQAKSKKVENEDLPETLTDVYSEEESEVLYRIVEAEATGGKIKDKQNVANVILNRVESELFPNTIKEVVFQKSGKYFQFSPIGDKRYFSVEITKDTIKACKKAFIECDTTNGALFFDIGVDSWASLNKKYIFTDDLGHNFYK